MSVFGDEAEDDERKCARVWLGKVEVEKRISDFSTALLTVRL